jgi:iron complex transport system ATP-binding protein
MVVEQALNGTTDKITMWEVITHYGTISRSTAETIAQWVFGDRTTVQEMKDRPLQELSQGEQKLALMAAALALRPNVLILDEPTTGLDWISRRRVLALLERVCQATPNDLSLIFITHYQEELVPSISHVLHLDHGYAVYQGPKSEYNPLVIPKRDKKKKAK